MKDDRFKSILVCHMQTSHTTNVKRMCLCAYVRMRCVSICMTECLIERSQQIHNRENKVKGYICFQRIKMEKTVCVCVRACVCYNKTLACMSIVRKRRRSWKRRRGARSPEDCDKMIVSDTQTTTNVIKITTISIPNHLHV